MNKFERFKKVAALNAIEVKKIDEIKDELERLGYGSEDYFKKNNISIVKALSANTKEANAVVDVSDEEKLSCIIDVERLIILIDRNKIVDNMHEAYKEAYKAKASNYMIFISQESKTADIEKRLISGVQGAKKLTFVIT